MADLQYIKINDTTYTIDDPDSVTGPASSTDGHVAAFSGTTGRLIKDTGKTLGTSVPAFTSSDSGKSLTINSVGNIVTTTMTDMKTAMSLNNVENKSSATIRGELTSTNVTTALGYTPINSAVKGANNGVAELDSTGKVPASQLPSYVDDVLEYDSSSGFPSTGESGKIYVAKDTNKTYRWGGSSYVEISPSLALGETSSTAYRGDRGKTAYDHASAKGSAYSSGLYKITTNAQGHVTAATAVAKGDITALGIPAQDTTYESKAAASGGTAVSLVTTGEKYTWNNKASTNVVTTSANGLMSSTDKSKLDGINGINVYYVEGPSSDTTAGTWTGTISGLTSYYNGLTVLYVPAVAGASTTTLNINGLGAKTCYYSGTAKLTTHYPVGTPILFTFRNDTWGRADYDSNTNTQMRVYRQTTGYNADYPLIASRTQTIGTVGSNGTYTAIYGVVGDTNIPTVNPQTGLVKFKGLTVTDKITGSISGDAGTVSGHTVGTNVPSFTSSDAGKFLTIGSNGSIVATTMVAWAGGNY